MAARGPDGGIKPWKPKHRDADGVASASVTGVRDGGAAAKSGINNGGLKEWRPRLGAGNGAVKPFVSKEVLDASASPSGATVPCVGCAGKLQLAAGTKDALRGKLRSALVHAAEFALDLFDSVLVEASSSVPAFASPANGAGTNAAKASAWAERGFSVATKDGALVVTGVDPGSPADVAGIDVGDRIVSVENAPRVDTIALFAEKMAIDTFDANKLVIDRNGVRFPIEVARA